MFASVHKSLFLSHLFLLILCGATFGATGTLRIVTYNIEADTTQVGPRTGLDTALEAIGTASVGSGTTHAQPLDIVGLEETTSESATVAPIVTNLNSFYGTGVYASAGLQGLSSSNVVDGGNGPNALIYNTKTLTLLSATGLATPTGSSNGVYRQVLRYKFQPIAGTTADTFYVYVEHYKSGTGTSDGTARNKEAVALRSDSSMLGANAHVIYTGDFNVDYSEANASGESTFTTLEASGTGAAIDPYKNVTSQANLTQSSTNFTYRDDYQLQTQPTTTDATGVELINGTYTTFGNNGTSTTATRSDLRTASDHLPVFADYSYVLAPEPTALSLLGAIGLPSLRRRRA